MYTFPYSLILCQVFWPNSRDEKVLGTRDVVYQASNSIGLTFQLLQCISLKKEKAKVSKYYCGRVCSLMADQSNEPFNLLCCWPIVHFKLIDNWSPSKALDEVMAWQSEYRMGFTLYQVTEYLPASSVKDGHVKLVPTNFSYSLENQGRSVSQITLVCNLYPTILRLLGQNFKQIFFDSRWW